MKSSSFAFYQSYLSGLRNHLEQHRTSSLNKATALGERAIALGIDTLELAKVHEIAMDSLPKSPSNRLTASMEKHAGRFFSSASAAIEKTHPSAQESNMHLQVMINTLRERTKELAESNEELRGEILQRKVIEESLRASERTSIAHLEKSKEMQEQLRQLSRRLLSIQEEERKRISRELHDVIAQALTGINVRLTALKNQTTASEKDFQTKIESTQRLVEKSVDIVHRFARDLRPAVLDDLGLIPALKSFVKSFMEQTGLRVSITAFAAVEQLEITKRTVLFRIAQEAMSNVAQHAAATNVSLAITQTANLTRMTIHDDGHGFDVQNLARSRKVNRLGLLGMKERTEMIGGTFSVESSSATGSTIKVEIPRSSPRKKKAAKNKPIHS